MADAQDINILKDINAELQRQVDYEARLARIRGEEVSQLENQIKLLAKKKDVQENIESILAEENREVRMKAIELMEEEAELAKQKGRITTSAYQNQIDLANELRNVTNDASDEAFQRLQKRLKEEEKLNKALERQTKAMLAGQKAGAGMASGMAKILGIAGETDTVFGQLLSTMNVFENGFKGTFSGLGSVVKGFAKEFRNNFNFTSAFSFMLNNQIEVGLAFHQMRTELSRATGAGFEYAHSIEDAQERAANLGITLSTATQSTAALYDEFERFTTFSRGTRTDLVELTSKLEEVGISGFTSARALNFMVSELNQSLPEAMNQMREFAEVGVEMGIPPRELAETYVQLMPQLSIFGQRSKQVFNDAAIFSKKLGLSVGETANDIIGLSDRLGTFEGAAKGVAAINIAMGGSFINAFDLAMKKSESPIAQLHYLRDAIQASGKSLDELGVFAKEFLEDELGNRFGKLQALLQGEALDEATIKTEAVTLEEQVSRNTTAMAKLQAATEASTPHLAAMEKGFSDVTSKMADLTKAIGGLQYVLIGLATVSAIGSGINLLRGMNQAGGGLKGFLGGAIGRQTSRNQAGDAILRRQSTFASVSPNAKTGSGVIASPNSGLKRVPVGTAARMGGKATAATQGLRQAAGAGGLATKLGSKVLPGVGLALSLGFAGSRLLRGDLLGAGGELASGLVGLVPGLGTVAALGIQGALAARDSMPSNTPAAESIKSSEPKKAAQISTAALTKTATENAMLRQELRNLRGSMDKLSTAQNNNKQPIKVDLYLDRSGTKKIAEASIHELDKKYLSRGRASNV